MNAQEIMTKNPACCSPDTKLNQVARMMVEHDCGEIPVVDQSGNLQGVVTDRDICCRAVANDCNTCEVSAHEIMSAPVMCVRMDTSVDECAHKMEQNMIRRIPVVDENGKCCGIVSQADIACKADGQIEELLVQVSQPMTSASSVGA
jgi:CBS domain-containing protein